MKKKLLFIVMSITCLGLSAQSISTKAPKASISEAKAKTSLNLDRNDNIQQSQKTNALINSEPIQNKSLSIKSIKGSSKLSHIGTGVLRSEKATNAAIAFYSRPDGYFRWGLTEDYTFFEATYPLLGPAYQPAMWYNYSNEDSETYKWQFTDPTFTSPTPLVLTDIHPVIEYPYAEFDAPILEASGAGSTNSQYQLNGFVRTGGDASFLFKDATELTFHGVGNYDIEKNFISAIDEPGKYLFGTGSQDVWGTGSKTLAVGNFFEKPLSKYMFEKFWINAISFEGDADAELVLTIRRVGENGILGDTIATSICYGGDVMNPISGSPLNIIPFYFYTVDPETGLEEQTYIEIEDAIFVELTGFNSDKVRSLSILLQGGSNLTDEANAYAVLLYDGEVGLYSTVDLLNPAYGYSSFLFNMDVIYPFMLTDNNKYDAPVSGGTHEFEIISYWNSSAWGYELPSWISFGEVFQNPQTGNLVLPVTVEALPSGVNGRHANIKIGSYATDVTLEIKQGDQTGVTLDVHESAFKAVRQGDSFVLSYPEDVTAVSVFNIAGQKVAEYTLNAGGEYTMPSADLINGVYVLKFTGLSNSSLKIVK